MTLPRPTREEVDLAYLASADAAPGVRWHDASVDDSGQFHRVLIAPHEGVVCRITRSHEAGVNDSRRELAATLLERRVALVDALATRGLPWQLPVSLGPVVHVGGRAAVVQRRVEGRPHPWGSGDPRQLRRICEALADVDTAGLEPLLSRPFWFRGPWTHQRVEVLCSLPREAVPRDWDARVTRVAELVTGWTTAEGAPRSLVHGDLAGANMLWRHQGDVWRLNGVIDWDNACLWDRVVNVAHLSLWHGPAIIEATARDGDEAGRARVWAASMGLEALADAQGRVLAGERVRVESRIVV